ncbi:hypothetical protein MTO96_025236 [Rhipicephalus appendiculatus]
MIVLFAGQKVPNYVKYGSLLVRCGLYRKHFDAWKQCGKVGLRRDVCPNSNIRVRFGCGIANPSEGHERECKLKEKLCGRTVSDGREGMQKQVQDAVRGRETAMGTQDGCHAATTGSGKLFAVVSTACRDTLRRIKAVR